ncbi:MAG: type I methionyl aminopeptidase, partial [Spirochaetales bacterium]|nr:type I methionyl aminopeptidase [Spirochaetales bacterium]
MILLKTEEQIDGIRKSCKLLAQLLEYMDGKIAPGMSTWDVDQKCHEFIVKHGGKPAFLHFEGFPGSVCVSVNEEVIHGIPRKKHIIHDGDIVTIDAGIDLKGYFSDSAWTYMIGDVKPEVQKLVKVTRECLYKGIGALDKPHCRIQDIGEAVYEHAHRNGFGVVREYCGHGVGLKVHEDPEIPNYVSRFSPNPRIR